MIKTTKVSLYRYIEDLVDQGYREYEGDNGLPKEEKLILASLYLLQSKDWEREENVIQNPKFAELIHYFICYGLNPVNEDFCQIPSDVVKSLLLDNVEGYLHQAFDKEIAFRIASYNDRQYDNDCDGEVRLHV